MTRDHLDEQFEAYPPVTTTRLLAVNSLRPWPRLNAGECKRRLVTLVWSTDKPGLSRPTTSARRVTTLGGR